MITFKLHDVQSTPIESLPILEEAQKTLGFIPNLYAHLAESPVALQAYKQLGALFEQSSLTPEEQQVVLLAVSVENGCTYCVAAHLFLARHRAGMADETLAALRSREDLPDARLNALAAFTRAIVRARGWVADSSEFKSFLAAGYTPQQALEVILGVTMKTLSNYANHLTCTPLDAAFSGEAWDPSIDPLPG